MSAHTFLIEYEKWLRSGRPGLAPSPIPHGILASDVIRETSELEGRIRKESGLSSWLYYEPKRYAAMLEQQRAAAR
jgi:hypothetical protein